jgi:hypothetical protein
MENNLSPIREGILAHFNNADARVVQSFGFDHRLFSNDKYRWAHYEHYTTDKVEIVHLVVMPWQNSRAPIYGFDVINISGNLTGMFLDLTPVDSRTWQLPQVGTPRPVPEWGGFFSDSFVCCKPNSVQDVAVAVDVLTRYLTWLPDMTTDNYVESQQAYIEGQRQNPQTRKMLAAHIGQEKADEYFYNYLWPDVK